MINLRATGDWLKQSGIKAQELLDGSKVQEARSLFALPKLDVRSKTGIWEKQNARLQRRLVRVYDQWSRQTRLAIEAIPGATKWQIEGIVRRSAPALQARLQQTIDVSLLGLIKNVPNPSGALGFTLLNQRKVAAEAISSSLMPGITNGLVSSVQAGATDFRQVFRALRFRPAQHAGSHWVALFEVQKILGLEREQHRRLNGQAAERVKWVLDPNAVHCSDSPGHFGCIGLAGIYNSWGALPAVPAGQVTCRGNCRCVIAVEVGKRWVRGVPGL